MSAAAAPVVSLVRARRRHTRAHTHHCHHRRLRYPPFHRAFPAPATLCSLAELSGMTCGIITMAVLGTDARAWGKNTLGQLGNSTKTNQLSPVVVFGFAVEFSAGIDHSCARLSTGSARCTGHNNFGQLGDGSLVDRDSPVDVLGLGTVGVAQIAVGASHSCARLSDGTARCWGSNAAGQLGDGTSKDSSSALAVPALTGVAKLVCGKAHTCTLLTSGEVKCWGSNVSGEIGEGADGVTVPKRLTPTAVAW